MSNTITQRVISTLAILVLIFFLSSIALLKYQGGRLLSVQSGSMEPGISKGDLLVSIPYSKTSDIRVGDIVSYMGPQSVPTTHRVDSTSFPEGQLTTKGDANPLPDKSISVRRVSGKVVLTLPFLGYALDFTKKPLGLALLIYLPALFVIRREIVLLAKHYKSSSYSIFTRHTNKDKSPKDRGNTVVTSMICAVLLPSISVWGLLQARASALQTRNSIGLPNSTISSFIPAQFDSIAVCNFPKHEVLLSYAPIDTSYPEPQDDPLTLDRPIPAGSYRIQAQSFDNHSRPNQPSQPNERWYAILYDEEGREISRTGVTDDLPDAISDNTTTTDQSLLLSSDAHAIRYVHYAQDTGMERDNFAGREFDQLSDFEKRSVVWNSIHPVCVSFLVD